MAKSKLGRGIGALIPKDLDPSLLEGNEDRIRKVLITDIKPNPDQPRREFEQSAHVELTTSIKQHGVVQPIIVVPAGSGYMIVAGERRWRAAKSANLTHVPALVRSLKEIEQLELALIENIQRVDLSPMEQAMSVYRLQHNFNLSLDQIADKLGKAQSTVSNLSRLLRLPKDAQEALKQGKITEGHARAILSLQGSERKQAELLRSILDNGWTVRQAEQFAGSAKKGASSEQARAKASNQNALTEQVSRSLDTKVTIKHLARGGQLIVAFKNESDLSRIAKRINKSSE